MIEGHCFTNLNEYQGERWPNQFVAVPRIGDRVRASSGKSLKVVDIIHIMVDVRNENGCVVDSEPRIKVELHR